MIEHGVGVFYSGGAGEAKFTDQAVLKGAPGALDAAFGLGRVGGDLSDAELVEGASELGGRLFSGEFFGERPVRIVALKDTVTVAVEAEGHAVSGDHGVQSAQISNGVFGFELEVRGENLTGGIVLKADESEVRAAAFEPVMTAGVGEHHHAETRAGHAARAIFTGPGASAERPVSRPARCGARSRG